MQLETHAYFKAAARHLTRQYEEASSPWPPIAIAAERLTRKWRGQTHDSIRAAACMRGALQKPKPYSTAIACRCSPWAKDCERTHIRGNTSSLDHRCVNQDVVIP